MSQNNHFSHRVRLDAPVVCDDVEQAVFDAVPFAGAGRQMRDGEGQAGLIGQPLQLRLP
jgi:hypothetical protein